LRVRAREFLDESDIPFGHLPKYRGQLKIHGAMILPDNDEA
jgi:hypothetical protein